MEKQSYKHFKNLTKFHFLYFMLFLISFTNCIIEIPIKKVKVEGIPKYKHIKIKESDELFKNLNKTILIDDGSTILNSNTLFLGIVKVGSKGQQFNLVLDTGSSITWVAKAGSIDKHRISHHLDPSSSTTSINTGTKFEQKYGTGYCKGFYYRDYFSYIGKNIFNIKFGVADETEFGVDRGDGIIGLSHDYKDESTSFTLKH